MSDCAANCPYLGRIIKLETQYDHSNPLITTMDGKLDKVIQGLGRIEILELKHVNLSDSIKQAFTRIDNVEDQLGKTVRTLSDMLSQLKGMTRLTTVAYTVLGGMGGFILNKLI